MSVVNRNQLLFDRIQELSERELLERIVKPLFEKEYERVELYHGPDEEGKDLVCWKRALFGGVDATVVQVKRQRLTRRTMSGRGIPFVASQLGQAIEKTLTSHDGTRVLPSQVLFITPFEVSSKELRSRFEELRELRGHGRLVDGRQLVEAVMRVAPELAMEVLDLPEKLTAELPQLDGNQELMLALDARADRNPALFYTDLDVDVGEAPTFSLLRTGFTPCEQDTTVSVDELTEIVEKLRRLATSKRFSVEAFLRELVERSSSSVT